MPDRPNQDRHQRANRGAWIAFLLCCFALTGLVGLFGTYATSIPLERAMHRYAALDEALAVDPPDQAAIRTALGKEAEPVLNGPGPLADRVAHARAGVRSEAEAEQRGVAARSRLMLGVITLLAAGLGTGILLLATKQAA